MADPVGTANENLYTNTAVDVGQDDDSDDWWDDALEDTKEFIQTPLGAVGLGLAAVCLYRWKPVKKWRRKFFR